MARVIPIVAGMLAALVAGRSLHATTIEDVCPSNPTPPDPCLVTDHVVVDAGSVLDAGTRALVVTAGKSLDSGTGTMTVQAAKVTLEDAAHLRGRRVTVRANGSPGVDGDIALFGASSIDVDSLMTLTAARDVRVEGDLVGGDVDVTAAGDVSLDDVTAPGEFLSILAGGTVMLDGAVDLSDVFNGGELDVDTPGDIVVNGNVNLSGRHVEGGSGGSVLAFARNFTMNGTLLATGSAAHDIGNEGGLGGTVEIEATGSIRFFGDAIMTAGNGGPGGQAFLTAGGDVQVGTMDLHTLGLSQGAGGANDSFLEVRAQGAVVLGSVDVDGAGGGGAFVDAAGAVTLGNVSARGTSPFGGGGDIEVNAGGPLTVGGILNTGGNDYDGVITLEGCDVTVEQGAALRAGPQEGRVDVTAHEQLTIAGSVEADTAALRYRAGGPTPVVTGSVTPPVAPVAVTLSACGSSSVCGNGTIELPEECDDGAGNGTPGDPCSAMCAEYPPALRIPGGGSKSTDCAAEWSVQLAPGAVVVDHAGVPRNSQVCTDGDAACDGDPTPGLCQFRVWECLGGADARIGCSATEVSDVEVRRPTPTGGPSARAALAGALRSVGGPVGPGEQCTRRIRIDVPAGRTLKLQTRTLLSTGRTDPDTLKLRCRAP